MEEEATNDEEVVFNVVLPSANAVELRDSMDGVFVAAVRVLGLDVRKGDLISAVRGSDVTGMDAARVTEKLKKYRRVQAEACTTPNTHG